MSLTDRLTHPVTTMSAAVLLGGSLIAPSALAQMPECPNNLIVAFPGTGETNAEADPNQQIGMLANATVPLTDGKSPEEVQAHYVAYPAIAVDPNSGETYTQSRDEGIANGTSVIADKMANCENTQFTLTGYSQGADVAGMLAQAIGTRQSEIPPERIASVALLSDPGQSPENGNTVNGESTGFGGGRGSLGELEDRTLWVCDEEDMVCNTPTDKPLLNMLGKLGSNVDFTDPVAGATEIVEGLSQATGEAAGAPAPEGAAPDTSGQEATDGDNSSDSGTDAADSAPADTDSTTDGNDETSTLVESGSDDAAPAPADTDDADSANSADTGTEPDEDSEDADQTSPSAETEIDNAPESDLAEQVKTETDRVFSQISTPDTRSTTDTPPAPAAESSPQDSLTSVLDGVTKAAQTGDVAGAQDQLQKAQTQASSIEKNLSGTNLSQDIGTIITALQQAFDLLIKGDLLGAGGKVAEIIPLVVDVGGRVATTIGQIVSKLPIAEIGAAGATLTAISAMVASQNYAGLPPLIGTLVGQLSNISAKVNESGVLEEMPALANSMFNIPEDELLGEATDFATFLASGAHTRYADTTYDNGKTGTEELSTFMESHLA